MNAPVQGVGKRAALLVATLSAFLAPFMISAVNIAIPVIGGQFGASALVLSWFATAYLLTATMFLVPFGRLGDIYGRKRMFTLGICALSLVFWKLKGEWAGARGEKFDFTGSVMYSLALVSFIYGLSRLPAGWAWGLVAVGVLGAMVFVSWEMRVRHPVMDVSLFRHNTVFAFSNLAALINYSATYAVAFLMSLYLQYIKGFSPETAGLVLVSQPAVMAALSPLAGRLSDRVEPVLVASVGMGFTTLGLFFLIFLGEETSLALIIPNLMVLGLGFALFSSPNTNAVMGSVEKRYLGVAAGTIGTMRTIGQILSMGIAMLIFSVIIGGTQITAETNPDFLRSARVAFIIFTAMCAAGIFASIARGKVRRQPAG